MMNRQGMGKSSNVTDGTQSGQHDEQTRNGYANRQIWADSKGADTSCMYQSEQTLAKQSSIHSLVTCVVKR